MLPTILNFLAVIAPWAWQYTQAQVFAALLPVCRIPCISHLEIPFCDYGLRKTGTPAGESNFPELTMLQIKLGKILEISADNYCVALDLQRSQFAVADLAIISSVPNDSLGGLSAELSISLDRLYGSIKFVTRKLSKFDTRVNGAVDSILDLNNIHLKHIRRAYSEAFPQNPTFLWHFEKMFLAAPQRKVDRVISRCFAQASNRTEATIDDIIMEGAMVFAGLSDLGSILTSSPVMAFRTFRDDGEINSSYLGQLFARLVSFIRRLFAGPGVTRVIVSPNLESYRRHLAAIDIHLHQIYTYLGNLARLLQQMQSDLHSLRTVSLANHTQIPTGFHMDSIELGIERLRSTKILANELACRYGIMDN